MAKPIKSAAQQIKEAVELRSTAKLTPAQRKAALDAYRKKG